MKKHTVGIRLSTPTYNTLCQLGEVSGDAPGTIARRLIEMALEANLVESLADKNAMVLNLIENLSFKQDELTDITLRTERLLRETSELNRRLERNLERITKSNI